MDLYTDATAWKFYGLIVSLILISLLIGSCQSESPIEPDSPDSPIHTDHSDEPHSRQKRFIYFNTQSPVDIGMLFF